VENIRRHAPATGRNREPILAVMRRHFPERGLVLEISSGTGEHAAFFSRSLPELIWQPSDIDPPSLESIEARRSDGSANLRSPVGIDAREDAWPIESADVVVNINMIHISPWASCQGLMRGAGRVLGEAGLLYLYGPYHVDGQHTAPSNEAFDASLRQRNPEWGVRDMGDVIAEAKAHGLDLVENVEMPANNYSLIFRRSGPPS
jgi:hypothetical protein